MLLIALFLLLVIIEMIILHFFKKEQVPWKAIIANLNSGHIMLWVFRGLIITAYLYIYKNISFQLFENWSQLSQIIFTLFAWDVCFYWSHRFHHKIKFLWAIHTVHHDSEHYNLSLGIRNSWYSSLSSFPFFSILAISGIPIEIFLGVSAFHYFVQFYNHNNLVKKSGWLEYIFITPSSHRVHHGKNDLYINKNFGGTFVFWDKLFHTYQAERKDTPVEFGIHQPLLSENPFLMSNPPLVKIFTGCQHKMNSVFPFSIPLYLVVSCSLLLFILMLNFMHLEKVISGFEKLILFLIIFSGTIANAGLSEARRWSIPAWLFICIIVVPVSLFYYNVNYSSLLVPLFLLIGHGIWIGLFFIKMKYKKPLPLKISWNN